MCLCHYVFTTNLFGASVKIFREEVEYISYFASVEQFQLSFPKVGIL